MRPQTPTEGSEQVERRIWWVARNTSRNRWQFECGHTVKARAEQSAKWYRREFNRRAIVVFVPKGADRYEQLRRALT